MSDRDDPSAR